MTTLVVISHYNAWPADQLVALLDQMAAVPAGAAFDTCVVVNQAVATELALPERFAGVQLLHRLNTGFNIGAWDHGWRTNPGHDCYLFLQEECRIVRPGWLWAFRRVAMRPRVGVVGEAMQWAGLDWERLEQQYWGVPRRPTGDGGVAPYPQELRAGLRAAGVAEGRTGAHLQSLVICMRGTVLAAINGFRVGRLYQEAVLAEVMLTKQVEALGLRAREVGPGSFRYVEHPQWAAQAGVKRAIGRVVLRHLPQRWADRLRAVQTTDRARDPSAVDRRAARANGVERRRARRYSPASIGSLQGMSPIVTTLVVISHYNAWPADQLVALLDQTAAVPAGADFAVCVVVNQAKPAELSLPERHAHVPVIHRENTGYNIGAWDRGWRANPGHDCYLFLQEECRIVRPGWVEAHRRLAMRPGIGLVGEAMQWAGRSWDRLRWEYRDAMFEHPLAEGPVPYPVGIRAGLRDAGLAEGRTGAHLQSLVLCARAEVLAATDGFPIGMTYGEAVVAEVTISKRVEALGLKVREVGPGSFRYILHPQWQGRQGLRQALGRAVLRNMPAALAERLRSGMG